MTGWAPVVYGRTVTSDTWWRAVPDGLDRDGWLGTVVHSVLAGGRELRQRPRFLLAQNATHRIVGVACQAGDLSTSMRSVGSRGAFCFVGWVAARTQRSGTAAPELGELERGYARWAAPVYERMLADVWDASPTTYCPPVVTQPERVPWTPPARQSLPGLPPDTGPWAAESWPLIWAAAQATTDPLTCVVGWRNMSSARFEDATHIGVADAPARPAPTVEYVAPIASAIPAESAGEAPEVPAGSVITSDHADGELGVPVPAPAGEPPAARPPVPGFLPAWARLTAAAAVGAIVAGVIVAIIFSGAAPAPAGPPVRLQAVIPASGQQVVDSLVRYRAGALSPGESTARMAVWSGGSAAGPADCASTVAGVALAQPVRAVPGLRVCIELKGNPSRYGLLEVTKVTAALVTATATIWP